VSSLFERCEPRADVLAGRVAEAEFAADLAQVVRVTADAGFFELHAESCELFSPGSPLFPSLGIDAEPPDRAGFERLIGKD